MSKQGDSVCNTGDVDHHWEWGYLGIENKIEFVPVDWLRALMLDNHGDVTITTNDELIDTAELGRRLRDEGLRYAGVVEVSRETRRARLIAGNHRLLAMLGTGITHFPVYVVIKDRFTRQPDETGVDQGANLTDRAAATAGDAIEPPSAVFQDIQRMRAAGQLPPTQFGAAPPTA